MSVWRVRSLAFVVASVSACNGLLGIRTIPEPSDDGGAAASSTGDSRDASDDGDAVDANTMPKAVDGGDASAWDAGDASASDGGDASVFDAGDASTGDGGDAAVIDAQSGCYPTPSGIVSWWRAEGTAADSVGPNNGVGPNVTYVPGMVGQAFHFDGTAYVVAPATSLPLGVDDRTMELWGRISIEYGDGGDDFSLGLFLGYGNWNSGGNVFELLVAGDSTSNIPANTLTFSQWGDLITTTPSLTEDAWHHLAVTMASGKIALYIDGAPVTQSKTTVSVDITDAGTTYLGSQPVSFQDAPSQWLIGDVDEAAVYARALDPDEIRGIFAAGAHGKCP